MDCLRRIHILYFIMCCAWFEVGSSSSSSSSSRSSTASTRRSSDGGVDSGGDTARAAPTGTMPHHQTGRRTTSTCSTRWRPNKGIIANNSKTDNSNHASVTRSVTARDRALIAALEFGLPALALNLLSAGANANTRSKGGDYPLHLATGNASSPESAPKLVRSLLRSGADETVVDRGGRTPGERVRSRLRNNELFYAGRRRHDLLVVELLARAPADRAWRRRGVWALCRAYSDRARMGDSQAASGHTTISTTTTAAAGDAVGKFRAPSATIFTASCGACVVDDMMADDASCTGYLAARNGGSISGGRGGGKRGAAAAADREDRYYGGGDSDFCYVAATVLGLGDEGVFREIVGFL